MGYHKKHSDELYKANDSLARDTVLSYLRGHGHFAMNNSDQFGPDIVLYGGLKPLSYIEVEIKQAWQGGKFPFPTIQLPERKGKYLRLGLPIEFWILAAGLEAAVIIPDYVITKDMLVEVPNRYIPEGELFFQVPVDLCIIRRLT